MEFETVQKTFTCVQINTGNIKEVFPLLCPVREKDWIDGWNYKMIKSISGLIEENCVFTTEQHGKLETVWYVTQYDKENYKIEFIRVTPIENTVRINIELEKIDSITTKSHISYVYTILDKKDIVTKIKEIEQSFSDSMNYWEKAINHYLKTGKMLQNLRCRIRNLKKLPIIIFISI